jgi:tripartite ATP-independent transporter DctP family solute receptor
MKDISTILPLYMCLYCTILIYDTINENYLNVGGRMKNYIWVIIFVSIGMIVSIKIGFDFQPFTEPIAYDDEQSGLNEQIVIKFSHVVAENTPKGRAAQKFAQLVEQKTNHKVKVEVFANGILYSDQDEIEALKKGSVQMIAPASSKLSTLFPEWQVLDLPFAFPTYAAVAEAFEGDIGNHLFKLVEKENFKGLAFWNNGFKQVTSNKRPLMHPSDFSGQHFRIMPSAVIEEQFNTLNARTSKLPFNQTYRNLENNNIDGQENTLSNIYSKKFYEVQDYMTISNHGFLGYAVIINKEFWNGLPTDIQQNIAEAINETTVWIDEYATQINQKTLEKIKANSAIQIHELTPTEKKEWIDQLEPVYIKFEPVIGKRLMRDIREIKNKYTIDRLGNGR